MSHKKKHSITIMDDSQIVKRKTVDRVVVQYREYLSSGEVVISKGSYKDWDEKGSYTVFYNESLDGAVFAIPTRLICSIEIFRE